MAITANKYKNIRAALCCDEEMAQLARKHNDANVLCMGARLIEKNKALRILKSFLESDFEGGRHLNRIKKITECL
jgi:ribose 5-phosphate isomerase B